MKVLVVGSRNWGDIEAIKIAFSKYIIELPENVTLIHGGSRGLDILAKRVGKELGYKVIEISADWKRHHLSAELVRNREMLDCQPELILYFDENIPLSKGVKELINEAKQRKLKVICGSP